MATLTQIVNTSHENMIHDAKLDYYGTTLASCSSDTTIKVFDVKNQTHTLKTTLKGHSGPVWQISWCHPRFGKILASCSYDKTVIIWQELNDGNWVKAFTYEGHDSSVNSVEWAPHEFGCKLACGGSDGSFAIITLARDGKWLANKKKEAHSIGLNALSWAPASYNESYLHTADPKNSNNSPVMRLATGGCDSLVRIWRNDGTSNEWIEEANLNGHQDWVRDVAFSPDVGFSRQQLASCSADGVVIIWNQQVTPQSNNNNNQIWTPTTLHNFQNSVWQLSWSITGNVLSIASGDNKVTLWIEDLNGKWTCITESENDPTENAN